ncbi:MAG: ABC transporter, partial [Nitrospirae bacterium]
MEINVIYVIVFREFKRFTRERSRMFAAVARPLIWLFFVGSGMSKLISYGSGMTYMQFIFPGILGMTILFSSIFSSLSIIWDREFGFMKEMLVAPISTTSIVIGKGMSGSLIATFQAVVVLACFPIIGFKLGVFKIVTTIAVCILLSFCISLIGIIVASFFKSFESFSVIMNFIVMPMFFLSGAMYPVKTLSHILKIGTILNPLTYG